MGSPISSETRQALKTQTQQPRLTIVNRSRRYSSSRYSSSLVLPCYCSTRSQRFPLSLFPLVFTSIKSVYFTASSPSFGSGEGKKGYPSLSCLLHLCSIWVFRQQRRGMWPESKGFQITPSGLRCWIFIYWVFFIQKCPDCSSLLSLSLPSLEVCTVRKNIHISSTSVSRINFLSYPAETRKIHRGKMAKMCKFWSLWCIPLVLLLCVTLASGLRSRNRGNAPVDNKGLVSLMAPQDLPLAQAPKPVLIEADVVEPPLPSGVSKAAAPFDTGNELISSPPTPEPHGQPKVPAAVLLACMASTALLLAILSTILGPCSNFFFVLADVALPSAFLLYAMALFIYIFQHLITL